MTDRRIVVPVDAPRFRWIVAAWLAMGAMDALQAYARNSASRTEFDALETLLGPLPAYAMLAALSPAVFALARRFPWERRSPRHLLVHVAAALAFPFVHLPLSAVATHAVFLAAGRTNVVASTLVVDWLGSYFALDVLRYVLILVAYHAVAVRAESHRNQLVAERARRDAIESAAAADQVRLQSLTSQLRPHFLFNSLNTIDGLIVGGQQERASHVVGELARVLRASLTSSDDVATVASEIALVDSYLSIEKERLGARLEFTKAVAAESVDALVPRFLIQLLVENAVRHGVAASPGQGVVRLDVSISADTVLIVVENSMAARETGADTRGSGVGLANIRARLAQLYGTAAHLMVDFSAGASVRATASIPLARSSATAASSTAAARRACAPRHTTP